MARSGSRGEASPGARAAGAQAPGYEERGAVGFLHFAFLNGAMSTEQCRRLQAAVKQARTRPTRVPVLLGAPDFWSNGIQLNVIEAASNPADESWLNINAMNDVVHEILTIEDKLVVSALQGSAGAGGVILGLAADQIWARPGVIANPHYRGMGGLYGSEYWTYLLPRRVGSRRALSLTTELEPIGAQEACAIGLFDEVFGDSRDSFPLEVAARAAALAASADYATTLARKVAERHRDEARKPLATYRREELARMHENFSGPDRSYHEARKRFVYKLCAVDCAVTPFPATAPLREVLRTA